MAVLFLDKGGFFPWQFRVFVSQRVQLSQSDFADTRNILDLEHGMNLPALDRLKTGNRQVGDCQDKSIVV